MNPFRSLVVCGLLFAGACSQADEQLARQLTGGVPERGRVALDAYGCGACHEIPGVPRARGRVGPSLRALALRTYLAGQFPNEPTALIAWIRAPQALRPGNAMPDLGVGEREARDMAAYLYTLR